MIMIIIEVTVAVVLGIVCIVYIILNRRMEKRAVKLAMQIQKQNELLQEEVEYLKHIFAKQYEEVKKKYSMGEREHEKF